MRVSVRPGQLLTLLGSVLAVAGGFAPWYLARATYGGQSFDLINANGFQEPNPGLSVLAIGLCVTAGAVAAAELFVPNARRGQSPMQILGFAPISLGMSAFALVLAKYLWQETYASVGFLVTGSGAVLVALGGVLMFASGVLARRVDQNDADSDASTAPVPAPS